MKAISIFILSIIIFLAIKNIPTILSILLEYKEMIKIISNYLIMVATVVIFSLDKNNYKHN